MQLLMKEPVKRENNNLVYVFKINSTKNRRIYIGVLDKNARINEKTSVRSPNSVCYSGFGFIFSGTEQNDIKTVKSGFKVGDVVRMKVSLEEGRIEWTVNTFNKCVQ